MAKRNSMPVDRGDVQVWISGSFTRWSGTQEQLRAEPKLLPERFEWPQSDEQKTWTVGEFEFTLEPHYQRKERAAGIWTLDIERGGHTWADHGTREAEKRTAQILWAFSARGETQRQLWRAARGDGRFQITLLNLGCRPKGKARRSTSA